MIYTIYHKTSFHYHGLVSFSHNIARLNPKESYRQKVLESTIVIDPQAYEVSEFLDIFGNKNMHMLIREPHQTLEVTSRSRVEIYPHLIDEAIERLKNSDMTYQKAIERLGSFQQEDVEAKHFIFQTQGVVKQKEAIKNYILESFLPERNLFEAAYEFMKRIFEDFDFVSGFSDLSTPVDKIFLAKKGVCQDFAQFAIYALRSIGLPAKYMSGYIETLPPEGEEKLFGADASHAWFALYIPGVGWAEFDPTNNMIPKEQHILLGEGRSYEDISPLKGVVMSSGGSSLSVMVDVRREESKKLRRSLSSSHQAQEQW
jgi:transglutaminase-like putative cysteine protease